jgi:hypothetical protein
MEEVRVATICLAGLCSGAVLGAAIATDTERKIRRGNTGWWPFPNASLVGIILNQVLWVAVIGALLTVVAVAILSAGDAYPLSQPDRYLLATSWVAGAAIAKFGRYRYWKSKDQWR